MRNVVPIVFCFDKRILLGASVAIKSLIDCALKTTAYDIRIFHSDLNIKEQKNLTKLIENTQHNIGFHYINPMLFKKMPKSNKSWTEIVYYRFLTSQILKEYEKVIYSDVDVLFKDDLTKLYNTEIEDFELGAVRAEKNTPQTIGHTYFKENLKDYIYWSGLLLINNKRFYEKAILNKLLENANLKFKELKFFDLDLMNITCQNIKPLDFKYCVLQSIYYSNNFENSKDYQYLKNVYSSEELINAKKHPAIIHYAGKPGKPWRMKHPYGDYQEYINKLPKELRHYTARDLRKKLFNKV